jgi:predicted O-methyltransferase YrrM
MQDRQTNQMIVGQLSEVERTLIVSVVATSSVPIRVALEVGTWYGGGSTLHILKALEDRGEGHLWGIEADQYVFDHMVENLTQRAGTTLLKRFTPLYGRSDGVIPRFLSEMTGKVDFVFLDGGDNPLEQIQEFKLLADRIPVGGQLLSHDAKLRKGKWFVPYISRLSNWQVAVHDISDEGLMAAAKMAPKPTLLSWAKAEVGLLIHRLHPVELAAALLPPSVNGWMLAHLPQGVATRLSQGRK